MISFKIFGIDKIEPKIIIWSFILLTLFGVAVTGLFEFLKIFPSLFSPDTYIRSFYWTLFVDLFPFVAFGSCICYLYVRYKPKQKTDESEKKPGVVDPHIGIVFALSKPQTSVEDIIKDIKDENKSLGYLYELPSIGQFFKILSHHGKLLQFVWPITTRDSKPYKECIEVFLKRFINKSAKVLGDDRDVSCHIDDDNDEEIINKTIKILSNIYSKTNLSNLNGKIKKSDVIVDITGGTKALTTGLVLGALHSEIDIQYLPQMRTKADIKQEVKNKTDINPPILLPKITPEIILDKIGDYLHELYVRNNESNRLK